MLEPVEGGGVNGRRGFNRKDPVSIYLSMYKWGCRISGGGGGEGGLQQEISEAQYVFIDILFKK